MAKKLMLGDMQEIAKARGGDCLSKDYMNSHTKLKWRCKKGHVWEAEPRSMRRGGWCPKCSQDAKIYVKKLTIKDMQDIARERGGKCLSKRYVNANKKLRWRCSEGHEWRAAPRSIRRGSWCPVCGYVKVGKEQRLTLKEMQDIARSRGGECLSKKYVNSRTKLKWRCKEGHEWESTPGIVKYGNCWCPYCSARGRLTIEEMKEIARTRGGECLSKRYIEAHTKLKWKCREGHEWNAIPANVKRGTWCPYCARTRRLTIDDMQKIARERGGVCLSKKYINAYIKLKWKCSKGHKWMAAPFNVKYQGTWCPKCARMKRRTKNSKSG